MGEPRARVIDGQKFMWDGREYGSPEEAERAGKEYEKERFETRSVEEDGKIHVYTRRVVTEAATEGATPARE